MEKVGNLKRRVRAAALVVTVAALVGVPLGASANPDISGFELDGNVASGGASDWNALGSPRGSKLDLDLSRWKWTDGTGDGTGFDFSTMRALNPFTFNPTKPQVKVVKATEPTNAGGKFDLQINGTTYADDVGHGGDTGWREVTPGQVTVGELAGTGTTLSNYVSKVECDSGKGSVDPGTSYQFSIDSGEQVTCTITNRRKPQVTVVKVTDPTTDQGKFNLLINGKVERADAMNGQGTGVTQVAAGPVTVSETAGTSTDLSDYSSKVDCDSGKGSTNPGTSHGFTVNYGDRVTCTITNTTNNDVPRGPGSIHVSKEAFPKSIQEPGGPVKFNVTITNSSADVDVTIESVFDDKFGDLDTNGGNGCIKVPDTLDPGESTYCSFTGNVTGPGGTVHINTVTGAGHDENGNSVSDSARARVDITSRLIDLVIVKEASSPTPLNGIVNYSLTVTNKGPDTATNVQLADPAPAGVTYLTANPSQGTCNVSPALITCSLGSIAAGQTVTIAITGRATTVGSHTNTATVTGGGGRETNPTDNVDSAVTVVPAPLKPPTTKPPTTKPKPESESCLALTVSTKMIKADGKPGKITVKVTAGKKRAPGVKVSVSGAGVSKAAKTNGKGVAVLKINPRQPGLITVTVVETDQKLCGPKRIGVVGVFLPPLTG